MRLIGDPLLDHWLVIGFCRARQLIWMGDWSGRPSSLRAHKPVVQDALAQGLNDLRALELASGADAFARVVGLDAALKGIATTVSERDWAE